MNNGVSDQQKAGVKVPFRWPAIDVGARDMWRTQLELQDYHRAMSKLLRNLRNVRDDEADDVRAMLDAHGIAFYETAPSIWGISN